MTLCAHMQVGWVFTRKCSEQWTPNIYMVTLIMLSKCLIEIFTCMFCICLISLFLVAAYKSSNVGNFVWNLRVWEKHMLICCIPWLIECIHFNSIPQDSYLASNLFTFVYAAVSGLRAISQLTSMIKKQKNFLFIELTVQLQIRSLLLS